MKGIENIQNYERGGSGRWDEVQQWGLDQQLGVRNWLRTHEDSTV
jgi:hypothetical protein